MFLYDTLTRRQAWGEGAKGSERGGGREGTRLQARRIPSKQLTGKKVRSTTWSLENRHRRGKIQSGARRQTPGRRKGQERHHRGFETGSQSEGRNRAHGVREWLLATARPQRRPAASVALNLKEKRQSARPHRPHGSSEALANLPPSTLAHASVFLAGGPGC